MAQGITSEDILRQQSLDSLKQAFYGQFKYVNYIPDLFELIEDDRLYEWIIEQFEAEFTTNELLKIFQYE